ncbi:CLUMA_CG007718, isoform A [Clunio marinus]|uniref:CLUMA_CG007718, isoform A n=1 Tax=Clunio marinus TaxID=568069 RepID=A0A1J1I350_9DIPT|nr:CLUMA_CG007718, isoform A [Clunio marinus]
MVRKTKAERAKKTILTCAKRLHRSFPTNNREHLRSENRQRQMSRVHFQFKPINEISHDTYYDSQLLFCGFLNEF